MAGRKGTEAGGDNADQLGGKPRIIRFQRRQRTRSNEFSVGDTLKHVSNVAKARGAEEYRWRYACHDVDAVNEPEGPDAERGARCTQAVTGDEKRLRAGLAQRNGLGQLRFDRIRRSLKARMGVASR